jgi:hypothetical protein
MRSRPIFIDLRAYFEDPVFQDHRSDGSHYDRLRGEHRIHLHIECVVNCDHH